MLQKSVKSLLANFKEMSINKFIAFKPSFFFPSLLLQLIFSSSPPPLFPGHSHCPVAAHRETGFSTVQERLYQRHMKAGWRWNFLCHSGNRGTDWPRHLLHWRSQRHRLNQTHTPNSLSHSWYSLIAHKTWASLSQFNLSPEHDDKMLANVSPALSGAPERSSPLSRAQAKQTQACTKASHKPQPTSQFPLWVFFSPSNTHKHIYVHTKAEGKCTRHRIFQERDRFYHFV